MKTKQSHFISYVSFRESLSPDHGVPEDAGVAKERQIGHVLGAVELDRKRSDSVGSSFVVHSPWGG